LRGVVTTSLSFCQSPSGSLLETFSVEAKTLQRILPERGFPKASLSCFFFRIMVAIPFDFLYGNERKHFFGSSRLKYFKNIYKNIFLKIFLKIFF